MSDPLEKLSSKGQGALAMLLVFPWVVLAVFTTDVLPPAWRFDNWPGTLKVISSAAFCLFVICEACFYFWHSFASQSKDKE
jgi:hypothetical protein